ncbi:MAG: hypothetical protein WCI88_14735, partial [Chloroflexota bacterium]
MMMTIPVAVTVCCGISCIVAFNMNAKPSPKHVGGIGPVDSPAGVKHGIKYTTSYDLYKKNVLQKFNQESNTVDPQQAEITKEFKKYIENAKKKLENNEPKVMLDLKAEAVTRKDAGFNADGILNEYLVSSSASSARIYSSLIRDGYISPDVVLTE